MQQVQARDGDFDDFFKHENQVCPPAPSQTRTMRRGNKAELLHCLEDLIP